MNKHFKIAAVGDNCMDVYDNLGEAYPGGNPVNVSVYIKRLGYESSYTGVVGNDEYGPVMINAIKEKGVDVSHLKTLQGKTAVTHVKLDNGERILGDYDEGVMADFVLEKEDIDFLKSHDLVVSGIWGMVDKYLKDIKSPETKIAFDYATKYDSEIIETSARYVDYAFFAWDNEDIDELKEFMISIKNKGAGTVIVTRGEKGSIAYDGNTFIECGIVKCNVVDTMGAGDSFIAGFLCGILSGNSIKDSMMIGAKNSSITLEYFGAW